VIYPVRTPFGLGGESPLAASIFHFGTYTVGDVKQFLQEQNIPVRL
jgi:cyclase